MALLVEGDAAGGDVEPVTIGDPPRRQQDDVGVDGCAPLRPGDLQLPRAGLGAVRGVHPCRHPKVVALTGEGCVALGDFGLFLAENRCAALDLGHLDAQCAEDVGELAPHEAAADDGHPLRQGVQPHDGVAGVQPAARVRLAQAVDGDTVGP